MHFLHTRKKKNICISKWVHEFVFRADLVDPFRFQTSLARPERSTWPDSGSFFRARSLSLSIGTPRLVGDEEEPSKEPPKRPFLISSAASKNRPRPPMRLRSMASTSPRSPAKSKLFSIDSTSLRRPGKSNGPRLDGPEEREPRSISSVTSSSVYSLLDWTNSAGLYIYIYIYRNNKTEGVKKDSEGFFNTSKIH